MCGGEKKDIKGANILVDNSGTIKLADFGASKQLKSLLSYSEGCATVTGTPYWMAPEVIKEGHGTSHYGRSADIWSVGAVVIEMITGKPPFHALPPMTALFRIGNSEVTPEIPERLSPEGKDFLSRCFQRNPKMRPMASELLSHPFVTGKTGSTLRLSNLSAENSSTTPVSSLTDNSFDSVDLTDPDSDQERDLSQFLRTSGVLSMNDILSDSTDGIPLYGDSILDAE